MWYVKNNGEVAKTTNPEMIQVEALFQELLLWQGENPMNTTLGIDYMGVFENRVFLKSNIEDICEKYTDSFSDIEVGDIVYDDDYREIISIPITITLIDGSTIRRNLATML